MKALDAGGPAESVRVEKLGHPEPPDSVHDDSTRWLRGSGHLHEGGS